MCALCGRDSELDTYICNKIKRASTLTPQSHKDKEKKMIESTPEPPITFASQQL